jgi:hypothetical protein
MPNLTNKPNKNKLLKGISIYFTVMRIYIEREGERVERERRI